MRRRENQCVASWTSPTGDLARNPGMCPDWESNRRPFDLQACTQSTEPHQPGSPSFQPWKLLVLFKRGLMLPFLWKIYSIPVSSEPTQNIRCFDCDLMNSQGNFCMTAFLQKLYLFVNTSIFPYLAVIPTRPGTLVYSCLPALSD